MNWFPLPIFPEGSLSSSVVVTVWIGVAVFCFMNLRFGWTFSGLVVPGYLVPLLIVKPGAAVAILLQSILTYFLVRWLTELMPKLGLACSMFGRDRFLALMLLSIPVRILFDKLLLPVVGDRINQFYGLNIDFHNHLHSFGLIVTCLAANQFWKSGFAKGWFPLAFNIAVTFVLVRFVLMPFTNFSISNLSFLYEDLAQTIDSSPKAYIILITTALIASRFNLKFGWDFNGIMIPALIALQWYEPVKVLASIVEAVVILGLAVLLLKTPLFKNITMEGARKVFLFFTISLLYKFAVGYITPYFDLKVKVSDYYGFGYLLPTLMAIKMHQLHRVVHQIAITVQISLFSMIIGNVIGFGLMLLNPAKSSDALKIESKPKNIQLPEGNLDDLTILENNQELDHWLLNYHLDNPDLMATKGSNLYLPPTEEELSRMEHGVILPMLQINAGNLAAVSELDKRAAEFGYQLVVFKPPNEGGQSLILREREDVETKRYWGTFILNISFSTEMMFQIPSRLEDNALVSWGSTQMKRLNARAFLYAATHAITNQDFSSELSHSANKVSFFNMVHQAYIRSLGASPGTIFQLRAYLPEETTALPDADILVATFDENTTKDGNKRAISPFYSKMKEDQVNVKMTSNDITEARYHVNVNLQASYLNAASNKSFALVWFSPGFRTNYRPFDLSSPILNQMRALRIPVEEVSLSEYLDNKEFRTAGTGIRRVHENLARYRQTQSILMLHDVMSDAIVDHATCVLDTETRQVYLVLFNVRKQVAVVMNLSPTAPGRQVDPRDYSVDAYIDSRATFLLQEGVRSQ